MRMRGLILISAAMLVISITITMLLLQRTNMSSRVDVVAMNEIVKLVEQHWPDIEAGNYSESDLVFSVLNEKGELIYQNNESADFSINEAIKNRSTVIDVSIMQDYVGKVLIHNNYEAVINDIKHRLVVALIIIFIVIAMFLLVYIVYIHQVI